jgi:hypothetical protein
VDEIEKHHEGSEASKMNFKEDNEMFIESVEKGSSKLLFALVVS